MIKKQLICGLFSLAAMQSFLQADECCEPAVIAGEPILCDEIPAIYPYPASVLLDCGWDFYVTGDFIYWKAYSNAAEIGIRNIANNGSRLLYIKDHYRPGFKVGLGVDLGALVLDAQYIRWHHSYKTNYSANPGESITPVSFTAQVVGIAALPGFQELRSKWKFHFDQILVTVQRPVYVGTNLVANIAVGVIADWVEEDTFINGINEVDGLNPGGPGSVIGLFKRWGVGPVLGLRSMALLPCGFRFIGNVDVHLAYLEWKGHTTLAFPPFNPLNAFINSTERYKKPVDYWRAGSSNAIGLGWESYLACQQYHVYLAVTYDLIATWSMGIPANDHVLRFDPTLHGWTLEARFDF